MNAEQLRTEIETADAQTQQIVLSFLALLLKAQETGAELPKVPEVSEGSADE